MKLSLKLEEVGLFVLGVFLFQQLNYSWWWFLALILVPDVGMLGYLVNSRLGAMTYNVFHHRGLAVGVYIAGLYFGIKEVSLAGIILFSHSSMDRIFGYGLKYFSGFKQTHLGEIGR